MRGPGATPVSPQLTALSPAALSRAPPGATPDGTVPTPAARRLCALAAAALLGSNAARAAERTPTAGPAAVPSLAAQLDPILAGPALRGARVGVCVVSLESGATLYARDADVLLNPASNVKLFTTAAALARLGPEFRFDTEFLLDPGPERAAAPRNLYVRGKGDPTMVTERLYAAAAELTHLGLRRVADIVLDDGWFDAERIAPGFDQEEGDRAYLAPSGALSLNFNTVAIHAAPGDREGAPGRVEVEPDSAFFEVVNRTVTVGPRSARRLVPASIAAPGKQRISVEGRLPLGSRATATWRKIDDPPMYFGQTLRRLLEARGVKVVGRVRTGPVPADARLLHVAESEPLGEVVRRLNKTSNNFMAEQLLKAMGAATVGPPGRRAAGVAAVEAFLEELGIPKGAYVMKNGSGLNDANRFSARQAVRLLQSMIRRFPLAPEYLASLPVAGKDGTIRWRMEGTEAAGRVRAKTGSLEGVVTLAGYAETATRERLAFAIFVNDHGGRWGTVVKAVDEVTAVLAGKGRTTATPTATSTSTSTPTAIPAPARTLTLARTYLAMGRAADRRNAPFLRGALQAEADPVTRLAAAEALFRSDPDSGAARRALLDATSPALDPAAVAALLTAADPADPVPILAALADLAADGNADALERLLALAPAATPGTPLAGPLQAILRDLAVAVPEALQGAAEGAAPEIRAAAAALVGDALPGLAGPAAEAPAIGPAEPRPAP